MAHSPQARKRIRQTAKQTEANRAGRSRLRTFVKKAEEAISAGDKDAIASTFRAAMSELSKGVRKGLLKKQTAARKTSRLAARIKAQA